MLKFFGRGSAFADEQNSAFFTDNSDLILIDCPMSTFHKIKMIGADKFVLPHTLKRIYILVTHTHGDHVSGIPMLIHYCFFVSHVPVTVVAPSREVRANLLYLIKRLEGCDSRGYRLICADSLKKNWFTAAVPTEHVPQLEGRCFGYRLNVRGTDIIYTGDTRTLAPFTKYLHQGCQLYTEISAYDSGVHLYIGMLADTLKKLSKKGVDVFLMHIDNEDVIKEYIKDTDIRLAELIDG